MIVPRMQCYFDDSSDPRREKYYACGGLLGREDVIDYLDASWLYEMKKEGVTKPVRSTELECGHEQFSDKNGWSETRRRKFMAQLVGVLDQWRIWGYASIVPADAYKRAFPDCDEHAPFLLAATQTIHNMVQLAHNAKADISMWFEGGDVYPAIARIYNKVRDSKQPGAFRMKGISAATKELRPLQAADLIAREAFKHSTNLGVIPTRKPVKRLAEELYFIRWTDKALQYLADQRRSRQSRTTS